jgi:hypothetical protein
MVRPHCRRDALRVALEGLGRNDRQQTGEPDGARGDAGDHGARAAEPGVPRPQLPRLGAQVSATSRGALAKVEHHHEEVAPGP